MSTRINLQIHRQPDIELIDHGIIDIRLLSDVVFHPIDRTEKDLPFLGIIDTGAPMSIIPYSIWSRCSTEIIQEESYVSGIMPGPDHMMKTKIGIISAELWDKTGSHYPISFHAHFAPIKKVPLVLGMQDLLQKGVMHIDVRGGNNWLEFK